MILDRLENVDAYVGLHPGLAAAFRALAEGGLTALPAGKHEVDGNRLFAVVVRQPGRGRGAARLEVHRKYIDVQWQVAGTDVMGWRATRLCTAPDGEFDADRDLGFFSDAPEAWVTVPPDTFVVFFPGDAHAPMAGEGPLHKVVMKVAVDGW